MKALVTGGAGFIGSNLVDELISLGHTVSVIDNQSSDSNGQYYWNPLAENHLCDINDFSAIVGASEGCDVIFHLAALARIQPSIKYPVPPLKTNVMGTLNVLEYARKSNTQVIYSGSSTKHAGIFKSPYAWSKFGGEQLCELYSKLYDLNTTICRFYNVYGDYHIRTGDYATVVGIFEEQFMNDKPITITSDGEQRRDFTHIDDIVEALVLCVGKDFRVEEFELGRGVNYSINEIANMFGEDYPKTYLPKRPGEYDTTLADSSNAKEKLGWIPKKNIKDYITNWVEENK